MNKDNSRDHSNLWKHGNWILGREEIGECFVNFFIDLFTSSNPSVPNNFKDLVTPSLSHEDVEMLIGLPSANEKKII